MRIGEGQDYTYVDVCESDYGGGVFDWVKIILFLFGVDCFNLRMETNKRGSMKGVQFGIVTSHNQRYFYQLLEEKLAKHQHCSSFLSSPTF